MTSARLQGLTKRHGSEACRACCKDDSGQGSKQENADKPSHRAFEIPPAAWTSSTVLQNTGRSPCKTSIICDWKSESKDQFIVFGEHGKNNTLACGQDCQFLRLAAGVQNCVGFIEFGRSSSCKHSAGNDLWNIVPKNSILDVNDVELLSTISLGRTCPYSFDTFCVDHASHMLFGLRNRQTVLSLSVSHKTVSRETRL